MSINSAVVLLRHVKNILLPLSILIVQILEFLSFSVFRLGCLGFWAKREIVLVVLSKSPELFLRNFFRSERYFGEYFSSITVLKAGFFSHLFKISLKFLKCRNRLCSPRAVLLKSLI